MQVQIEDVSPVEKKIAVEVPWERVRKRLDDAFKHLGKDAQIRGFRKGKVPRNVLERMFGRQVQMEVAKELVQETFIEAAQQHHFEPVAEPVVEKADMKLNEAFRWEARVEVRGPVELKETDGIPVSRRKVSVPEADVDKALERKRLMHTEFRPIEGRNETRDTDVVMISIKGKVGEIPIDRPELSVDLSDREHEPLQGLAAALTGIATDAKDLAITLDIPADAQQKEIAGQRAELVISVRDVREKMVPPLDDDFAKDTGEADTLDQLRAKLREQLEKQAADNANRDARDALLKELIKRNPVPVAPALVERGIDAQLSRARYSLAMQGIDFAQAGIDLDGMRDNLREGASEEIRGQLLLEAIADQNNLQPTDEEVDAKVAELARMQNKPINKVRAEMEREGTLSSLRWRLRQDKALDHLMSRATITESEAPAGEDTGKEG